MAQQETGETSTGGDHMNDTIIQILVSLALLAEGFGLGAWWLHRKHARSLQAYRQMQARYRTRVGWRLGYGNYRLVTLDGGRCWYDFTTDEQEAVHISGLADAALVRELEGTEALSAHIATHGPLDIDDAAVWPLLEAAGFEVRRREQQERRPRWPQESEA